MEGNGEIEMACAGCNEAQKPNAKADDITCTGTQWWLSFADPEGFKGVVVVNATSLDHAIRQTWALGLNPGGEVAGMRLERGVGPECMYKLLDKEQVLALGAEGMEEEHA